MSTHYDIAVIGGGPGGTAAAITASWRGARVLLFERGTYPRHKVCGEFVSHEGVAVLNALLRNTSLLDSAVEISRARIYAGAREVPIDLPNPGTSLSRNELDEALWRSAIDSGVDCRDGCEVLRIGRDSPFTIETRGETFTATVVINASGRWSRISRKQLPAGARERWIGLKAHFRETNPSPTTDLYFLDGGYCGVQPVARDVVNVCAMMRGGTASSLGRVCELSSQLNARSRHWTPVFEELACAPVQFQPLTPVAENVFNVGDAAGFVDPFAGDGISLALRSGILAAGFASGVVASRLTLPESLDLYAREYHGRFRTIFRSAAVLRRGLSLPPVARETMLWALCFPSVARFAVRMTRG